MGHFSVILAIFTFIFIISFYIFYSDSKIQIFDFFNSEPFDNFDSFNDLESIESSVCRPFVVRPKQADLLDLVKPLRFSCNSPMGPYASFSNLGFLTISEKLNLKRIEENEMNQTCVYTEIVKIGEHPINGTLVGGSRQEITIEPAIPTKIPLEQFVVYCRDATGRHFYNKTFFNFQPKIEKKLSENLSENPENLMILSVSGISHNQAMRHLKTSLEFAAENDFQSFSMFNQKTSNNSINSLASFGGGKLWKHRQNCWKFLQTDSRQFGARFGAQFDFFPDFYNRYNRQYLAQVDNCIADGRVIVEDDVTLWKNFSTTLSPQNCHFSLLHLTNFTKFSDGELINLDEILKTSMEELLIDGTLNRTTMVILSDGGSLESSTFSTESGQLEAKYGLFLIRLSDEFRRKNPGKLAILKRNADRLITNENIAETLEELIDPKKSIISKSLLSTEIRLENDCEMAKIDNSTCICSKIVDFETENEKSIMELLRKAVENEVSGQKCLEKIDITMENSGKFQKTGNTNFFKFYVNLTTKTSKLAENRSLEKKKFKFKGIARFSRHLELAGNLKNTNSTDLPLDQICSKTFYSRIHTDFRGVQ